MTEQPETRFSHNGHDRERALPVVQAEHDHEVIRRLEERVPSTKYHAKVVFVIPAHNEEENIALTISGARSQTYAAHRIVVMSDNSTDRTIEIAREQGAEVHETVDNQGKKGGAINQALDLVLPTLDDNDFVVTMDADGTVAPDIVEVAMEIFQSRPGLGALSGSVRCRDANTWIETAQAIEYERGRRVMARKGGKIHVLSGAAAFFKVSVLRHVAEMRGKILPGIQGRYMLEGSLVEDYELTLAVQQLGYSITSSKRLLLITDLMPTVKDLEDQRIRWYRGTIETLGLYGVSPFTRFTMASIGFNMTTSTLLPMATMSLLTGYLLFGGVPSLLFFGLVPFFVAENYICARRVGTREAKILALTYFPLWIYDNIQFAIYWRAFKHAVLRKESLWTSSQGDYE